MENNSALEAQKVPTSHKWTLTCFCIFAAINIYLNARGYFDALGVFVTIASIVGFASMLIFRHSQRTYAIGVIALFTLLPQKPSLDAGDLELFELIATHGAMALHHAELRAGA